MSSVSTAQSTRDDGYLDPSVVDGLAAIMPESAVQDLLVDLKRDVRERLVRLSEIQVAAGSLSVIAQDAHDLRSMGGNFGLTELSQQAGAVERAARNEDLDTARSALPPLISVGYQSLDALEQHPVLRNSRSL